MLVADLRGPLLRLETLLDGESLSSALMSATPACFTAIKGCATLSVSILIPLTSSSEKIGFSVEACLDMVLSACEVWALECRGKVVDGSEERSV